MDLFNNGPENPILSQNVSDVGTIRGVMTQKRETLKCIDREIEQLVEKRKGVEEDLVRLGIVVAPHNHNHLPNEVLSRIFILVAQDYGPVHFPIFKSTKPPPQLAISHVCSRWRGVALHTSELWGYTHLTYPERNRAAFYPRYWRRWLIRAGTLPVRLSIDFIDYNDEIASVLQTLLLPFRVKRLHLSLTYRNLVELSTLPEATIPNLIDLSLDLTLPDAKQNTNIHDPHHLITRLRSLTVFGHEFDGWLGKLYPVFPWSQLQSLNFGHMLLTDLHLLIEILRQTPNLQVLNLQIHRFYIKLLQELTMPSLRDFTLSVWMDTNEGTDLDGILRSFICPSLVRLELNFYGPWTVESFEIIKRQYNMQGLEEIVLGCFPLSISSILQNAPILRTLSVRKGVVLDDAAIIGISSGTLGRFLTNLNLSPIYCDVNEVISMVEKRMKTVNALIRNGCSWREDITILKVLVDIRHSKDKRLVIAKLKEAGINVTLECCSH
ncbi:hypothetical protein F5887DRAFT_1283517 [Amanita rubescens]|nr:hypothetical protein F5887DRAFT_1283517 [Amanita rubescens]